MNEFPLRCDRFATFIASFDGPVTTTDEEFEPLLWSQLQQLHDLDSNHHSWESSVSADPNDPQFSFSFAERSFFIVGLHAAASRRARRFTWPTLVFNAHAQFEFLREAGGMPRMQTAIRNRERRLQGDVNPMLADHGEASETAQYAGRHVDPAWVLPPARPAPCVGQDGNRRRSPYPGGCSSVLAAVMGFTVFAALITVTPGPDSLLVLRNGVAAGRKASLWTGVGAASGSLAWGVVAAVGLAAVLQQWPLAYDVIKYTGVAYLAYLGLQALLQRHPPDPTTPILGREQPVAQRHQTAGHDVQVALSSGRAFGTGLLSNLLNPKVGLFFLAVAPQFLPRGYPPLQMTLLFGVIDALVALTWLSILAFVTSQALRWLRRPRVRLHLERFTGLCLLGLAIATAIESR